MATALNEQANCPRSHRTTHHTGRQRTTLKPQQVRLKYAPPHIPPFQSKGIHSIEGTQSAPGPRNSKLGWEIAKYPHTTAGAANHDSLIFTKSFSSAYKKKQSVVFLWCASMCFLLAIFAYLRHLLNKRRQDSAPVSSKQHFNILAQTAPVPTRYLP